MKNSVSPPSRSIPAPQTKGHPHAPRLGTATLIGIGLFLLVLATFCPVLNNDLINYDDPDYLTANQHVQQGLGWESFKWAFASCCLRRNSIRPPATDDPR